MPDPAHKERAHAWASPSKLDRVLACPAAASFEEAMGPEVRDPDGPAARGERMHEVAERLLRSWGDDMTTDGPDTVECVRPYLDAVRASYGGKLGASLGRLLLVEERVDVAPPLCFGTFDAAVVDPFDCRIAVFDLKTGTSPVPAVESVQLGAYACGLLAKHVGKPKQWDGWTVELVIVQPRGLDGAGPVKTWTTTGAWCARLHKRIAAGLKLAKAPGPVPKAGEHCGWCRAKAKCPAQLAKVASAFPVAAVDNPAGDPPGELVGKPPVVELLDDMTLARVLDVADDIEAFIAACRARAATVGCPGWKLVAGKRGARRWTDPATAAAALKGAGLDPFAAPPLKSPTVVEKEVGKDAFSSAGFAVLVEAPAGKPALVRETDPRPALPAGSMFPAVPAGDAGAAS